jgi:hypothetical protein
MDHQQWLGVRLVLKIVRSDLIQRLRVMTYEDALFQLAAARVFC